MVAMSDDETKATTIHSRYGFGDIVYLRVRQDKNCGMVTGLHVRQTGVSYSVTWEDGVERGHFECELSSEFTPRFDQ